MATGKNTQQSRLLLVNCECYTTEQLIWTHLVCSNFRLNVKQLLAQHNPLLGHTWLPSPWELSHGFTESFFMGVLIPLMYSCLHCFHACWSSVPSRTCDSFNAFLPQEPLGPSLPMIITFHLETPGRALQPIYLVVTQQFNTSLHVSFGGGMLYYNYDNLHHLTACWQIISEHPSNFKNSGLSITRLMFQHSQECGISCH
jgi:hypothetical protein